MLKLDNMEEIMDVLTRCDSPVSLVTSDGGGFIANSGKLLEKNGNKLEMKMNGSVFASFELSKATGLSAIVIGELPKKILQNEDIPKEIIIKEKEIIHHHVDDGFLP